MYGVADLCAIVTLYVYIGLNVDSKQHGRWRGVLYRISPLLGDF
jgi:hypothetical protein